MVIGQNLEPITRACSRPYVMPSIAATSIIHVNPLAEAGLTRFKHPQDYMKGQMKSTTLADLHLQVRIGGDAAL